MKLKNKKNAVIFTQVYNFYILEIHCWPSCLFLQHPIFFNIKIDEKGSIDIIANSVHEMAIILQIQQDVVLS